LQGQESAGFTNKSIQKEMDREIFGITQIDQHQAQQEQA